MKYQSIIVEDLQVAAEFLKRFCEKSGIVTFLTISSMLIFLQFLKDNVVDLIFLMLKCPRAGLSC